MSHYVNCFEDHKVAFRPGYMKTDFDKWWSRQKACHRDGCSRVVLRSFNDKNWSETVEKRFVKAYSKKNPDNYDFLEFPDSYTCNGVLIGIVGWRAVRKVRKVVNHHIQEVEETKDYKTRPKTPLKGSTLYAVGKFVISYDARCYDPMEHGDFEVEDDF